MIGIDARRVTAPEAGVVVVKMNPLVEDLPPQQLPRKAVCVNVLAVDAELSVPSLHPVSDPQPAGNAGYGMDWPVNIDSAPETLLWGSSEIAYAAHIDSFVVGHAPGTRNARGHLNSTGDRDLPTG